KAAIDSFSSRCWTLPRRWQTFQGIPQPSQGAISLPQVQGGLAVEPGFVLATDADAMVGEVWRARILCQQHVDGDLEVRGHAGQDVQGLALLLVEVQRQHLVEAQGAENVLRVTLGES